MTISPDAAVTFCLVLDGLFMSLELASQMTGVPVPVGHAIEVIDEVFSTIGPPDCPLVM